MNKLQEAAGKLAVAKRLRDAAKIDVPWIEFHVEMTADLAAVLLGAERTNRSLKTRKISGQARDMASGKWRLNGTAVKLDEEGHLTDGSHRLRAVMLADEAHPGIRVPMTVQVGVPLDYRPTFDTGTVRSFADVLTLDGVRGQPGTRVFASIIRYIALYMVNALATKGTVMPTHEELQIIMADNDTKKVVEDYLELYARKVRVQQSTIGFVYWRAMQDAPDLANAWVAGVGSGTDMSADDPRFQLRERYLEPRSIARLDAIESMALAIKSWNLFSAGKTANELRWRSRGRGAEAFPAFLSDLKPERLRELERARVKVDKRRVKALAGIGK